MYDYAFSENSDYDDDDDQFDFNDSNQPKKAPELDPSKILICSICFFNLIQFNISFINI